MEGAREEGSTVLGGHLPTGPWPALAFCEQAAGGLQDSGIP